MKYRTRIYYTVEQKCPSSSWDLAQAGAANRPPLFKRIASLQSPAFVSYGSSVAHSACASD